MKKRQWIHIFKALGNATRLEILRLLWGGEVLNVTEIASSIDVSLKTASHNLNMLARLQLVESHETRGHVYYRRHSLLLRETERVLSICFRNYR